MVPGAGIEPARSHLRGILSPLRLPVPPSGRLRVQDWRLGPESNRRTRICNPLHHHSATQPLVTISTIHVEISSLADLNTGLKKQMPRTASRPRHRCRSWPALPTNCGIWSGKPGSNRRPQPWQGCALPTELRPQRPAMVSAWSEIPHLRARKPAAVTRRMTEGRSEGSRCHRRAHLRRRRSWRSPCSRSGLA